MPRESLPTLRRNHSSSSESSTNNPYDQAEQGFHVDRTHFPSTPQPLETRKPLSLRYSLRSTDSTLAGFPGESLSADFDDGSIKQLPRQERLRQSISWTARCLQSLRILFTFWSNFHDLPEIVPENFKRGYDQFQYENHETIEKHPDGWPRVAAFLEGCNSFGIYRRFGQCHSRLLVTHMSNITEMEKQLEYLDWSDENGGEATNWRLKNRIHEEGFDVTKRDLLARLEKEVIDYDDLLLRHHRLKSLDQTPKRDHDSVFRWIWKEKPLDVEEYDWIFRPDDFVSIVPPRRNSFENFIEDHLKSWPKSYLKRFFKIDSKLRSDSNSPMHIFSTERISTWARLIVVFLAVLILFVPVILFLLTSMSRACMAVVVLSFVFVFSVMMSLLSDAGVQEIFVGTSTYCAVLVTFLGNLQNTS